MCHKKHRWIRGIVSQGGYPILTYRPKMLRIGGGGASLRMARQRMSFSSSSSFWSASSKFMPAARSGGPRGHPGGRVLLIERNARLLGGVRGRVGLALEGGGQGARAGIEVRHGLHAQQKLHGAQHGGGVVHAAVHGVALHPGRNQEGARK